MQNLPVNPAGRRIVFEEPRGVLDVRCTVHSNEPPSTLVLINHPFFTRTAADGSFAISGVPALEVELAIVANGFAPKIHRVSKDTTGVPVEVR